MSCQQSLKIIIFHMATAASFSYETKKLKPAVFVSTEIADYQKLILSQR